MGSVLATRNSRCRDTVIHAQALHPNCMSQPTLFESVLTTLPLQPSQETPNPEQTASYFSLLTYSYLDRLILQAFRVPHLKLEELPPLQEKHTAAFVCERAFPVCVFVMLSP